MHARDAFITQHGNTAILHFKRVCLFTDNNNVSSGYWPRQWLSTSLLNYTNKGWNCVA